MYRRNFAYIVTTCSKTFRIRFIYVEGLTTTNKRGLWSIVTRTMRAMKLTKTSKILPNKGIDNGFESTLIAPDSETDETQPCKYC